MEKKKLMPFQMVARELGIDHGAQGSMRADEYELAFRGILNLLHDRALEALSDPNSREALELSQQYCAFAETLNVFGTALIAFDDIDDAELPPPEDPPAGTN